MDILYNELLSFLEKQNICNEYDYTVPIERKGMALLRILQESGEAKQIQNVIISPEKILSSEAISFLPDDWLLGKKIWVFDDSLFTGTRMKQVCDSLKNRGAVVKSGAFAVYEHTKFSPDIWFYQHLHFQAYAEIRNRILDFISSSENLILDTERIGLKIHCNLKSDEIIDNLRFLGEIIIVPRSMDTATKFISIHDPEFFDIDLIKKEIHNFRNLFYKLRFIVKDFEFWIIPIFYAPVKVPTSYKECPVYKFTNDREICVCSDENSSSNRAYYCRNIFWNLNLLATTANQISKIMEIEYDLNSDQDFPLTHLKSLFPDINLGKWKLLLNKLIEDANVHQQMKNIVPHNELEFSDTSKNVIMAILKQFLEKYDELELNFERKRNVLLSANVNLRTIAYGELFRKFPNIPSVYISQALDVLIDQAIITPTIINDEIDNQTFLTRGARLDGEFTYTWIRFLRNQLAKSEEILSEQI
jgi:hypothetical protein